MAQVNNPSWISDAFEMNVRFAISGVSLSSIVEKVSPPLYLYDTSIIRDQYNRLFQALSKHGIKIYYSVKANTALAILQELQELGAGFEVASLGELIAVDDINADFQSVSFAGPVKTNEELEFAISSNIFTINVESRDEFYRINAIAKEKGIIQRVGIRVNPLKEVKNAGGLMGGGSRKFGIDEELLTDNFFREILSFSNISLEGVHVFAATQILNARAFIANFKNTCRIAEKLHAIFPVKYIDFGGGLGVPYQQDEQSLPLDEVTAVLGKTLKQFPFIKNNNVQCFVEPGRYLVAQCGVYVIRVDHVKESRGRKILLVDGGINHMLRPALTVGSSKHPICNLTRKDGSLHTYDIAGSLCTSLDFFDKGVLLPETKAGDLLGVFIAGAYGWSEAMPYFLSHGIPAEVLVKENDFRVIRSAIHPKEFLNNQMREELYDHH